MDSRVVNRSTTTDVTSDIYWCQYNVDLGMLEINYPYTHITCFYECRLLRALIIVSRQVNPLARYQLADNESLAPVAHGAMGFLR